AAKLAVDTSDVVRQVRHARLRAVMDYEWVGKVQHWLQQEGAVVEAADYAAQAAFQFLVPLPRADHVRATLQDLTNGQVKPELLGELYWATPDAARSTD